MDKTLVSFENLNNNGSVFVSRDARTGEKDGYLTVEDGGHVILGGKPLDETSEPEVLRWASAALGRMLATGQRSPA